jgi:hypothetical protein
MVFLGSSCNETAKNAIKKIDGKRWKKKSFFSLNFFGQKVFYGVFELPLMRNAQKRHKKLNKLGSPSKWAISTACTTYGCLIRLAWLWVFARSCVVQAAPSKPCRIAGAPLQLPLMRNAQKRHKKINKKKGTYLPDLSSTRYTSLSFFFSSAPLARAHPHPAPLGPAWGSRVP